MAESGAIQMVLITKSQLRRALVDSGLSYEQPPEQDAQRVWEALHAQVIHVEMPPPCGPDEQLCDERCVRCGGTYRR